MHWKLIWKSFQHMPTTKHNLISLRIGIPKFLVLKGPEKKQDMKVLHMSGRSERYVADPIIHHAFFLRSESTLCHSELLILGNIFYSIQISSVGHSKGQCYVPLGQSRRSWLLWSESAQSVTCCPPPESGRPPITLPWCLSLTNPIPWFPQSWSANLQIFSLPIETFSGQIGAD